MPSDVSQLPRCERCGAQTYCIVSIIGNDLHVKLCPEPCQSLFLKAVKDWLRQQKAKG